MGDAEKQRQLKQWVRGSVCEDSIRRSWGKGEAQ
jgi:hypothetical protein